MANKETRIVFMGKTGSGKSSVGNTLSGQEDAFTVNDSVNSGTKSCETKTYNVHGKNIKLIDTPGVFDTDPTSRELSPELLKCVQECAPGAHAFLLVLKVEKFTKHEQAVVNLILKYFSEEALKYTTVVFTHGDDLPEKVKIKDWASENEVLKSLLQKCGGRCHVFDNKHWKNSQDPYRNNQHQVTELLNTIDQTVRQNGGRYYTNEMLKKVASDKRFLVTLAGVSTGVLLGALLGIPAMVAVIFSPAVLRLGVAGTIAVGAVAGVAGAAYGGYRGYKLAEQAETPGEAAEAVWQEAQDLLQQLFNLRMQNKYRKLQ